MIENIPQQNLALIWGTLRNIIDFSSYRIPTEIKIVGTFKGEFPINSYQKIYLEIPKTQEKNDLSGRLNDQFRDIKNNLWNIRRIIQLPYYEIEDIDCKLLEERFKSLLDVWNDTHIPKEIPCIAVALKIDGNYCNEREAQFIRIILVWENKIARNIDLEYYEGPLEDCISPEWYIKAFKFSSLKNIFLKLRNIQYFLPNWQNQTYKLLVIPSFLKKFLKNGKEGVILENGWGIEYNYQSRENFLLDLCFILEKINSYF